MSDKPKTLRPLWERKALALLKIRLLFERCGFSITQEQINRLKPGLGIKGTEESTNVFREVTEPYYRTWVYPLLSNLINQNARGADVRYNGPKDPCHGKYLYLGMPISAWQVEKADLENMAAWCHGTVVKNGVHLPDVDGLPQYARMGEWLCKESTAGFFVLPDAVFQKLYVKSPS